MLHSCYGACGAIDPQTFTGRPELWCDAGKKVSTMKSQLTCLGIIFLAGCSTSYPIRGQIENSSDSIIGIAKASLAKSNGEIRITISNGVTCTGSYPRPVGMGPASASGVLNCDNGTTGKFSYVGSYSGGEGFGRFSDGRAFKFVYDGHDAEAAFAAMGAVGNSMNRAAPMPTVAQPLPKIEAPTPVRCTTTNASWGNGTPIWSTSCH